MAVRNPYLAVQPPSPLGAPPPPAPGAVNTQQFTEGLTGPFFTPYMSGLEGIASGGAPVDVSGITQANIGAGNRQFQQMLGSLNERFGALGLGSSSARSRAIARAGGAVAAQIGEAGLRAEVAAQEAARQRQLAAYNQLAQIAQMRQQGLQAAGNLYLGGQGIDLDRARLAQQGAQFQQQFGAAYPPRPAFVGGSGDTGLGSGGYGGGGGLSVPQGFIGGLGGQTAQPLLLGQRAAGRNGSGAMLNIWRLPNGATVTRQASQGLPAFAEGGQVPGRDYGYDTVPALLRGGELVIPPELTRRIANTPATTDIIKRIHELYDNKPQYTHGGEVQYAQGGYNPGYALPGIGRALAQQNPQGLPGALSIPGFSPEQSSQLQGYNILQALYQENPQLAGLLSAHSDLAFANPQSLGGFADYVNRHGTPEAVAAAMEALGNSRTTAGILGGPGQATGLANMIIRNAPGGATGVLNKDQTAITSYIPSASQQSYLSGYSSPAYANVGAAPQFDPRTGGIFAYAHGGLTPSERKTILGVPGVSYEALALPTPPTFYPYGPPTRVGGPPQGLPQITEPLPANIADYILRNELEQGQAELDALNPPIPGLSLGEQALRDALRRADLFRSAMALGTQGSAENLRRLAPQYAGGIEDALKIYAQEQAGQERGAQRELQGRELGIREREATTRESAETRLREFALSQLKLAQARQKASILSAQADRIRQMITSKEVKGSARKKLEAQLQIIESQLQGLSDSVRSTDTGADEDAVINEILNATR